MRTVGCLLAVFLWFFIFSLNQAYAVMFSVASEQTSISKDDELSITVTITDITSCAKCYLQSAFTASLDNPKYLGQTQNNTGSWYVYSGSPTPDTIKSSFFYFEPVNNSWSGILKAKIDTADSDYKGSGTYYLKVSRYTGNSSSGSWADDPPIQVSVVDTSPSKTPIPSPTTVPSNTPKPSLTPKPSSTPKPTSTPKPSATSKPTPTIKPSLASNTAIKTTTTSLNPSNTLLKSVSIGPTATLSAEILGESTESSNFSISKKPKEPVKKLNNDVKVLGESSNSAIYIVIGGILLMVCAILGCWKYIKRHQYLS